MAVDKLVDSTQLDADLTSVANAIRTKGGTSAQMAFPAGFVSAIDRIPVGSGDLLNQFLLTENKYSFKVDIPDNAFDTYSMFIVAILLSTETSGDWIYATFNTTSLSGPYGTVTNSFTPCTFTITLREKTDSWNIYITGGNSGNVTSPQESGNYFNFRMYDSSKYFGAGSTVYLIGVR